ncbi:DUF2914 domain-containing protein [Marinobacter sp. X15-166B]|uniref:DUF2914 domain-containing protein n=1 Tax=Marinobacter sp. X15-166B TaxID=1897620 RepID=UPI00085BFEF3|nr:DUF2914 domain-containing protein [Marinobacter sp. X15-166B]OEY67592.1 hypothetical protein BG841_14890 [Marinobacter sp. X15-166B]
MKAQIYKEPPEVQESVSYRWDRILFTAVLALLLLSGIVWAIWSWASWADTEAEGTPLVLEERTRDPIPTVTATPAAVTDTPVSLPPTDAPFAAGLAGPESATDSPLDPVDEPADRPVEDGDSQPDELTGVAGDVDPNVEAPGETALALPTVTVSVSATDDSEHTAHAANGTLAPHTDVQPESAQTDGVITPEPAPVTIQSDQVVRAGVSEVLEAKELVGALPATVPMNDAGLLRVYFFNEVVGMNQQVYYHDWYLNDERQARVAIRPFTSPMRASSGKYVDRSMLGSWRVEAVSAEGELLAEARFEVVD